MKILKLVLYIVTFIFLINTIGFSSIWFTQNKYKCYDFEDNRLEYNLNTLNSIEIVQGKSLLAFSNGGLSFFKINKKYIEKQETGILYLEMKKTIFQIIFYSGKLKIEYKFDENNPDKIYLKYILI